MTATRAADIAPLGAIVGPTASGKSELALAVAERLRDVELVSIDAMQVYRGMDIGTAKPSADDAARVRHHLIDLVDPTEEMTVSRFKDAYSAAMADIRGRGHQAVLVGGTGLYARAVLDDLDIPGQFADTRREIEREADTTVLYTKLVEVDPVAAERMEPNNRRRVVRALEVTLGSGRPFSSYGPGLTTYPELDFPVIGLRLERPLLDERIAARYADQMQAGFLDEVRALFDAGTPISRTARQALGYRELLAHIEGDVPLDEALAEAETRTRRFARRQERWFRRDPRIDWLDVVGAPIDVLPQALALLGSPVNEMAAPQRGLRD